MLDRFVAELLAPLAVWVFASGLDDCFLDLWYLTEALGRWRRARPAADSIPRPARTRPESPIAILVPCWREAGVIRRMAERNLRAIEYSNYEIWIGVYPNDAACRDEVLGLSAERARVRAVVCPHEGPTTKADCLNQILKAVFEHERLSGDCYEIIVQHDAEDLIHPAALRRINELIERHDMVQLPVFPLPTPPAHFTHGVYCDEFAEFHLKDLPLRSRAGGFIPSAGVGTAYSRDAVDRLRILRGDELFHPGSLTEDYFIGVDLYRIGCAQAFALLPDGEEYVATRAYFPDGFRAALRQRIRWLVGNNFQAWERFGWRLPPSQWYWLWRDRKALIGHPVSLATNLIFIYGAATALAAAAAGVPWGFGRLLAETPALLWLLVANSGIFLWRQGVRVASTARIYGWKQAAAAPLRVPWANLLNCCAVFGAGFVYARARLGRRPLVWAKTSHVYPRSAAPARLRLGEMLCSLGLLDRAALESALERRREGERIGEALLRERLIDEEALYRTLAYQQGLEFGVVDPARIPPLPSELYFVDFKEAMEAIPAGLEPDGRLLVVGPAPAKREALARLALRTGREVRFVMVTPSNYEAILDSPLPLAGD